MAQCVIEPADGFWNVHANPLGPGYSRFGYVEGMNEPQVLEKLEDELFNCIGTAPGIRRAACGYEAQDWFLNSYGDLDRDIVNLSSLLYDRNLPLAGLQQTAEVGTVAKAKVGIVEFGPWYYRTLKLG